MTQTVTAPAPKRAFTLVHKDGALGLQAGQGLVGVGERAADSLGDLVPRGWRVLQEKDVDLRLQ